MQRFARFSSRLTGTASIAHATPLRLSGWGSSDASSGGWGSTDSSTAGGGWGSQPASGSGGDGWGAGSDGGWGSASSIPPAPAAGRGQGATWGAPADEGWGAAGGGRGRGNRGGRGGGFRGGGRGGGGGFRGRGGPPRGGGGGGGGWGAAAQTTSGGWGAAASGGGSWGSAPGGGGSWGQTTPQWGNQTEAGGAGNAVAGEWGTTTPSFTETAPRVDPMTLTAVAVEIDGIKKLVGQRVLITGVSDDTTWQSLKDHMRQAAECTFCKIFRGSRAVVAFATPEEAAKAITELQGSELEGSTIFLREDREDIIVVNTKRRIREAREALQREQKEQQQAKLLNEQPPLPTADTQQS